MSLRNFLKSLEAKAKSSKENTAIIVVSVVAVLASIMIIFSDKHGSKGGHGHGHGGGHGHGEGVEHHEESAPTVELDEDALEKSSVRLAKSEGKDIQRILKLRGRITVNRDKFVRISPRYGGVLRQVRKNLGDEVKRGDVLATIESSGARSTFEVRSAIGGFVVERQAIPGLYVTDKETIFTVADLSTVWAELNAYGEDLKEIKKGQTVRLKDVETGLAIDTTIFYVAAQLQEDTQALMVRASIDNQNLAWRPGSFVEAEIATTTTSAKVAVEKKALQYLDNKPVVFVRKDDEFEARSVRLGNEGKEMVEVLEGVESGEEYVADNSFILKAELLKFTAEHSH